MRNFRNDFTAAGYPVYNELIDILQNEMKKPMVAELNNLVNTFAVGNSGVVIYDLVIVNNGLTVGFPNNSMIYLNGEFMEPAPAISAQTFTLANSTFYLIQAPDVNESRQFADGLTQNLITSKYFTYTTTLPVGVPYIRYNAGKTERRKADLLFLKNAPMGTILTIASDAIRTTYFNGAGGLGSEKWNGWALCNGNNGTFDLQKKTLVGYSPTPSSDGVTTDNYAAVGNTGGSKTITISKTNLPNITIPVSGTVYVNAEKYVSLQSSATSGSQLPFEQLNNINYQLTGGFSGNTNALGDGTLVDVRNPYTVVLYIQKIA